MAQPRLDWNDFWHDQTNDPLTYIDDPRTWADVCWKVGLEEWLDRFRQFAPGPRMLECGCGMATLSRYMAQRGFECTMLDYSEKAVQIAQAGFAAKGLSGEFFVGDMNHLDFAENSFDIVYSGGALEFFEEIEKPISEMVRVLKPGGFFAVAMVPRKFSIQTIGDFQRTIAHAIHSVATGNLRDAFKSMHLIPSNYHVSSLPLKHYVRACQDAGLDDVKGLHTSPFPALALPKNLSRAYARYLYRNMHLWRKFNEKSVGWHRWIGITYTLYGTKR